MGRKSLSQRRQIYDNGFHIFSGTHYTYIIISLEIVITRAGPAFHNLFMVMGCVFDINTVHKTVEKLTFQAFY